MKRKMRRGGFTLLDVMISVTIIGILSTVGLQNFKTYKSRAKRPEATLVFRALADAQTAHKLATGRFAASFEELNFSIHGATMDSSETLVGSYYTFTMSQPFGEDSWYCVASGNIDGDRWVDVLAASSL